MEQAEVGFSVVEPAEHPLAPVLRKMVEDANVIVGVVDSGVKMDKSIAGQKAGLSYLQGMLSLGEHLGEDLDNFGDFRFPDGLLDGLSQKARLYAVIGVMMVAREQADSSR